MSMHMHDAHDEDIALSLQRIELVRRDAEAGRIAWVDAEREALAILAPELAEALSMSEV